MRIFDVRILDGVPFEDYLKLPGLSYSAVKDKKFEGPATAKMNFGSLVDAYVFEPHTYNGEQYELVVPVARRITRDLGPLIKAGRPQLAILCTMVHMGMYMYYKGRVDLFAGGMVIDLKVSEVSIMRAIEIFGYHHQLNGYAIGLDARQSILYSVHPKTTDIQMAAIPNRVDYWERAVLKHGRPC
jgi:hypothetical protein